MRIVLRSLTVLAVATLALPLRGNAAAQSSATYQLTKSVMSSGGTRSTSASYFLTGTFGQPFSNASPTPVADRDIPFFPCRTSGRFGNAGDYDRRRMERIGDWPVHSLHRVSSAFLCERGPNPKSGRDNSKPDPNGEMSGVDMPHVAPGSTSNRPSRTCGTSDGTRRFPRSFCRGKC